MVKLEHWGIPENLASWKPAKVLRIGHGGIDNRRNMYNYHQKTLCQELGSCNWGAFSARYPSSIVCN